MRRVVETLRDLVVDEAERAAFEEGRLYSVDIDMTGKCESACVYCYNFSTPESSQGLSFERLLKLIDECKDLGVQVINWVGGDPLLRPEWREVLSYSGSRGMVNTLMTAGGSLAETAICTDLARLADGVTIHFDSVDREAFTRMRRSPKPDYYELVIAGINELLAVGFPKEKLAITINLYKPYLPAFKQTVDWVLNEQGISPFNLFVQEYRPCGRQDLPEELECTQDEQAEAFGYFFEKIGLINADELAARCFPHCGFGDYKYYCGSNIHIRYNGDVRPCSFNDLVYGNVNRDSLRDIFQGHRSALLYRVEIKGVCANCAFGAICFGCRVNALMYLGDVSASDPKCWLNPESAPFLANRGV